MAFSAVGWRGFAKIGSNVIPLRRFDLDEQINIVNSEGVHGTGTVNAISSSYTNYSIAQIINEGTLEGEAWGGVGAKFADAYREIVNRAITSNDRETGFDQSNPIILAPTGEFYVWQYPSDSTPATRRACIKSLTISSRPGENVSFSAGVISSGRKKRTGITVTPATDFTFETVQTPTFTNGVISLNDNSNPIPYWKAKFTVAGTNETDLLNRVSEWTLEINNNSMPVFVHNGEPFAVDVAQGVMQVTGNFTYYSPDGNFIDAMTQGATLEILQGDAFKLKSDHVAFRQAPVPNEGLNTIVMRRVNYECYASSTHGSLYLE